MILCWTNRLFGGLIADIRRKLPWYGSDFTDCLHIQCVASVIFLFLATLTPNVTFGGLLGQATDQYMVSTGIYSLYIERDIIFTKILSIYIFFFCESF